MTTIFYLAGLGLLLFMGYVLWSGVGARRPVIGRAFAVLALGIAAYIVWLIVDGLV